MVGRHVVAGTGDAGLVADGSAVLKIPPQFLPPTHEGTQVMGTISAQAAEATGLRALLSLPNPLRSVDFPIHHILEQPIGVQ